MKNRPMRFKEVALTLAAIELSPGASAGMTVGPEVAQAEPAAIATVGSWTELLGGVDLTLASSRRDQQRWRGAGRLTVQGDVLRAGITVGFTGEPGERLGDLRAFSG